MKAVHQDLIRQRAYEIWEQSGRPDGLDLEHWAEAERQLLDAAPEIAASDPVIPETRNSPDKAVADEDAAPAATPRQPGTRVEPARAR